MAATAVLVEGLKGMKIKDDIKRVISASHLRIFCVPGAVAEPRSWNDFSKSSVLTCETLAGLCSLSLPKRWAFVAAACLFLGINSKDWLQQKESTSSVRVRSKMFPQCPHVFRVGAFGRRASKRGTRLISGLDWSMDEFRAQFAHGQSGGSSKGCTLVLGSSLRLLQFLTATDGSFPLSCPSTKSLSPRIQPTVHGLNSWKLWSKIKCSFNSCHLGCSSSSHCI